MCAYLDPFERAMQHNGDLSTAPCSTFELVDCTEDEQYFTLGHWLTLADAIAALDECKDPDDFCSDSCPDGYCKVEIREHKIGWSYHGKKVYQREWSQKYDEAKDEYEWRVRSVIYYTSVEIESLRRPLDGPRSPEQSKPPLYNEKLSR